MTEREIVRRAYAMTVKILRKRIGLAQESLALEAGVDRAYMSGLERSKHNPTLATVLRFLPHLKVTFAEFAAEFDICLRRAKWEARSRAMHDRKALG